MKLRGLYSDVWAFHLQQLLYVYTQLHSQYIHPLYKSGEPAYFHRSGLARETTSLPSRFDSSSVIVELLLLFTLSGIPGELSLLLGLSPSLGDTPLGAGGVSESLNLIAPGAISGREDLLSTGTGVEANCGPLPLVV